MTVQPTNKYPNLALPPFPVLRDLLAHVQLFLTEDSIPSPKTWDEIITQAKQVNIDTAEPWLGLEYSPEHAWELVAGRIGDRAAAVASILCGAIDLIRPIDAEPQRFLIDMSEDPGDLTGINLEEACAATLIEMRNIRHPAPPYTIEGLPSLANVHACFLLIDPDWEPLSPDAGWLGIFREARHDLSLEGEITDATWQQLRSALRNHGAAVSVVISSASVAVGGSRNCMSLLRQLLVRASPPSGHHLDTVLADLLRSSPRHSQGGSGFNGDQT